LKNSLENGFEEVFNDKRLEIKRLIFTLDFATKKLRQFLCNEIENDLCLFFINYAH